MARSPAPRPQHALLRRPGLASDNEGLPRRSPALTPLPSRAAPGLGLADAGGVGGPGASGQKAGVRPGEPAGRHARRPAPALRSRQRPSCLERGAEGDSRFPAGPGATVEPLVAADWGRGAFSAARDPLYSAEGVRGGRCPWAVLLRADFSRGKSSGAAAPERRVRRPGAWRPLTGDSGPEPRPTPFQLAASWC